MFGEDVIYCFLAAVKLQGDLWCFGALVLWCQRLFSVYYSVLTHTGLLGVEDLCEYFAEK